jgi:hypothetical protein
MTTGGNARATAIHHLAMSTPRSLRSVLRPRNIALLVVALALPAGASIGAAEAAPSFNKVPAAVQVTCRGPFMLDVGLSPSISARKASVAAGPFGRDLAPGECAVFDRPLGATERPIVSFHHAESVNPSDRHLNAVSMLSACALDADCVVTVVARIDAEQMFRVEQNRTATIHKFGHHPNRP